MKDLGLDYSVFELITKGVSIDKLRLNKPTVYLQREGDTWSLSRLIKKEEWEANRRGPGRPISIEAIPPHARMKSPISRCLSAGGHGE